MFKINGVIKLVKETVQVTEKFAKREFVITDTSSMYPQDILFQAAQDKTTMLDGFIEGQNVEVSFNLRGREWTSPQGEIKYFNTLDAWRIESIGAQPQEQQNADNNEQSQPKGDDDLPF